MWNDLMGFVQRCHARVLTLELSDLKRQEGQGLVEYGLILGLVSVVAVLALKEIGGEVKKVFEDIVKELKAAL
jgi:pilus assembly protein Flp/PilA